MIDALVIVLSVLVATSLAVARVEFANERVALPGAIALTRMVAKLPLPTLPARAATGTP